MSPAKGSQTRTSGQYRVPKEQYLALERKRPVAPVSVSWWLNVPRARWAQTVAQHWAEKTPGLPVEANSWDKSRG